MSPKTSPAAVALPKPQKVNLQELQEQQLEGTVQMQAANKDASHEIPTHEDHLVHLKLVTRTNNATTKQYDTKVDYQAVSVVDYEQMEKSGSLKQFDKVEITHDPRSAARQQADNKGLVKTNAVNEVGPKKVLRSMQDAQNRYQELFNDPAPSDQTFSQLKATIVAKEAEVDKAELTKARARYQTLYNEEAPGDRTLAELLEAIDHQEKENEAK